LQGITHTHLSEHLSECVENAVESLVNEQCVAVDPEDSMTLTDLNLGLVAAFYCIRHTSIGTRFSFNNSSTRRSAKICIGYLHYLLCPIVFP
jgi:hypothetical protein